MKKKSSKGKGLAYDLGTLAVIVLANRISEALEKRICAKDSEEALKRKLTIISLIYHAIGIVYNE